MGYEHHSARETASTGLEPGQLAFEWTTTGAGELLIRAYRFVSETKHRVRLAVLNKDGQPERTTERLKPVDLYSSPRDAWWAAVSRARHKVAKAQEHLCWAERELDNVRGDEGKQALNRAVAWAGRCSIEAKREG